MITSSQAGPRSLKVVVFDDEVAATRDLVSPLADNKFLDVAVTDQLDLFVDEARKPETALLIVDMGKMDASGIDLSYGEQALARLVSAGVELPVVVYSQYPMTPRPMERLRAEYPILREFVAKIAPEHVLHEKIECILEIDLGPARWVAPADQVAIEVVEFDPKTYRFLLEVPAWPVGEQFWVSAGAKVFSPFRRELLAAAETVSEDEPLICYGSARLEAENAFGLGLTISRIGGRYPPLESVNVDRFRKALVAGHDDEDDEDLDMRAVLGDTVT